MNDVTRTGAAASDLESIIEVGLAEAKRLGVDQAEVAASHDNGLSATARLGEV